MTTSTNQPGANFEATTTRDLTKLRGTKNENELTISSSTLHELSLPKKTKSQGPTTRTHDFQGTTTYPMHHKYGNHIQGKVY